MRAYFHMLLHSASRPGTTELSLSPIQMHSLRSFWALLIPSPGDRIVALRAEFHRRDRVRGRHLEIFPFSRSSFSSLLLAAVLVNPHLYIYDLLVLAPAMLLIADWAASQCSPWP